MNDKILAPSREDEGFAQWSFLVPLIGGRYHIIPQLALIYCLLGDYISPTTY